MSSPPSTLLPTSPSSPNAFSSFALTQSPRETYTMFYELGLLFRPRDRDFTHASESELDVDSDLEESWLNATTSGSLKKFKSSLKKLFGSA